MAVTTFASQRTSREGRSLSRGARVSEFRKLAAILVADIVRAGPWPPKFLRKSPTTEFGFGLARNPRVTPPTRGKIQVAIPAPFPHATCSLSPGSV